MQSCSINMELTLIGLPSTGMPLQVSTALVALSERTKVMLAIPRLPPVGPYDSSTLLTGPMVLAKYSYFVQDVVSDLAVFVLYEFANLDVGPQ